MYVKQQPTGSLERFEPITLTSTMSIGAQYPGILATSTKLGLTR